MNHQTKSVLIALALVAPLAGGCDPEDVDSRNGVGEAASQNSPIADAAALPIDVPLPPEPAPEAEQDIAIATDPLEVLTGWTPFTSEENPPMVCDGRGMVSAWSCQGDYCDDSRMRCRNAGKNGRESAWTSYFSEEGSNYRYCSQSWWIVGIDCQGSYCDNLSMQCRYFPDSTPKNCQWTGWISEEGGTLNFPSGYFARGMQCQGSYCDNKRFYICEP